MPAKLGHFAKLAPQLHTAMAGFKQLAHTPVVSLLIIGVLTCALTLAILAQQLWQSHEGIHKQWNASAEILLYLKKNISLPNTQELIVKLQHHPEIAQVALIGPEEGMQTIARDATLKLLLASFKENPLPFVIVVHPRLKMLAPTNGLELMQTLSKQPEIETVTADIPWLERSYSWLKLWDRLTWLCLVTLSINALLLISGISYMLAKSRATKPSGAKLILFYQLAWYSLISSLLALLIGNSIITTLQTHDIPIASLSGGLNLVIIVSTLLISFISAKTAT